MRRMIGALAAVAVLAGCDVGTVDPGPPVHLWYGLLEGASEWEHIEGEAAFEWLEGAQQITAAIAIIGDEPQAVRAWHLRTGTCAEGQGLIGSDEHYPPLQIGVNGAATVFTNVPAGVDPADTFHINVQLSAEDTDIIACADLELIDDGGF